MTYDPDRLRNLLLGGGSGEGEDPEGSEGELGKSGAGKAGKDAQSHDELARTPADAFAPLRDILLTSESESASSQAEKKERPEKQAREAEGAPAPSAAGRKKEAQVRKPKPVNPPSPLSLLALSGGGVALTAAVLALFISRAGSAPLMLSGIGLALVTGFLVVNRRWVRVALSSRSARYSANVGIAILSFLGILVLLNVISYRYHYRFDFSSDRLHSLSEQSLRVLDDINRAGETITVTAFVPQSSDVRLLIESLMELYLYHSRHLKFSFVDPDVKREFTESKGIDRASVLFELGDRRAVVTDFDEPHFTAALAALRQTRPKVAAFLTGHGELDPYSEDSSQSGISLFRKRLELENFEVTTLSIPEANGIPAETSLLIIAGPARDLEPRELELLTDYLDRGGRLMAFLEPGRSAGLESLLALYGIAVNSDLVLDDQRNYYGDPTAPIVSGDTESSLGSGLAGGVLLLRAGSLDFSAAVRLSGVETESVLRSSASSWSEKTDQLVFDEGVDRREALEMAILATRKVPGQAEDNSSERMARVLVVNDASFVQNANFQSYMNRDFVMNAANVLAETEGLFGMRERTLARRELALSPVQLTAVFAFSVVLTPLLIAGMGLWVWSRRR